MIISLLVEFVSDVDLRSFDVIMGPRLSFAGAALIFIVLSLVVTAAPGRLRFVGLLLWITGLALLSQRFTAVADEQVYSSWLLFKLGVRPYAEEDERPVRCDIGPIAAMCYTHAGVRTRYVTFIPLSRMDEVPSPIGPILAPSGK